MEKLIKECRGCASEEITREYECTCVYETVPQTMKKTKTARGFDLYEFSDAYQAKCSLQQSSLVEPHIWLGIDDVNPQIMTDYGWVDYPIPKEVLFTSRMHLNVEQVKELLPLLQEFVEKNQ